MSENELDLAPAAQAAGANRRNFLRGSMVVAGAAGLSPLLAACSSDGGSNGSIKAAKNAVGASAAGVDPKTLGKKHIAYIAIFQANENAGRLAKGIKAEADRAGWTLDIVDGGGDINKVQNQWQALLQKGVDGIISVQIDTKTWGPQIEAAAAKKTPYVALFSDWRDGVSAAIGTNGGSDGATLAQYVIDRTGGKGNGIIISSKQFSSLDNRRRAFEAALEPYPNLKIVENHELALPAYQQDALSATRAFLTKYKKGELQWIYSSLDETGVAAAQACVGAGRDEIFVCASDGAKAGIKMIQDGKPFAATTAPLFEQAGASAVRQLAQVMSGQPPLGRTLYIDGPFVDSHNVGTSDYFQGPAWKDGDVFAYWRG